MNKPVAWMDKETNNVIPVRVKNAKPSVFQDYVIPLYTHPEKELTDEEIMDELVKVKHTWVATTSVWFEFEKEELKKAIRAILRKAQEK